MKKLLGIILIMCMLFSGCAKEQNTDADQNVSPAAEETVAEEKAAEEKADIPGKTIDQMSEEEKEKAKEEMVFEEETVYFAIGIQDEEKLIFELAPVSIKKGDTALSVLKSLTKEKKIHMETSGKGDSEYVKGIDNIYEFDKGPQSGWIFYINGEFSSQSAGKTVLKDGDMVEWVYITEWTEGE